MISISSLVSYLESAHYLVIALIIILAYIILREGLKHASENHGSVAFVIIAMVFGLLLYLHLYLYSLLAFLTLILIAFYSIKKDEMEIRREVKRNAKRERLESKYKAKYPGDRHK